jgi:hypothetical protein
MPYKRYGIHSNEVLDRYFYYNPKDFVWMCRLTDTPACENAVQEIEQQLENESDLNFRGLLSDKVIYIRGHWVPLVHANGVSNEEQALVELAQNTMLLHSTLEDEWLMSTTTINEGTKGCRNRFAVDTGTPRLKPLILSSTHPAKSQGEHMFVPSITVQPATMEQDVKNLEADAVASAHLTREEDVHQEDAHHTEMTDASAHSDDDDKERLSSSGTGDALTDDEACHSECIKVACRRDMQVTGEGEGSNGEESWAPEDEVNEDTFINSNCSKETEDLAEEQGMVEEGDKNVTNTEEKPERTTQKGGRRYKGIIARERSTGEIIPIQIVGETWLEQEHRTMVIVLEDMTNGQIEVTTYNEAQGIVTRKIEDTDGHLRTVCEDLLELATIHVGQEEDSEEERIYTFIEDDDNRRPTTRRTVRFVEQREQRPCSGNSIHEDDEPMGWSEDVSE